MERYEEFSEAQQQANLKLFTFWVLVAQVLGLTAVILVAVWMGHFQGGFSWSDVEFPDKQFNYHPLFMTIGMIFLFGDAILVYRVFRNDRKKYIKILHAALHVFALVFAIIALKAVFDYHGKKMFANMYSLHSWLGMATIVLFGLQWIAGFVSFLSPWLGMDKRAAYKSVHVFWGLAIYLLGIAAALSGMLERAGAHVTDYSKYSGEGILVNITGFIFVALGIVVAYILTNPNYKRQPLPEEEHIQLTH